jgi:hypothetical protein
MKIPGRLPALCRARASSVGAETSCAVLWNQRDPNLKIPRRAGDPERPSGETDVRLLDGSVWRGGWAIVLFAGAPASAKPREFASPIRGVTQGIIVFEWQGNYNEFGAMGHADLFRVLLSPGSPPTLTPGCIGSCYFVSGPMIAQLWETRP